MVAVDMVAVVVAVVAAAAVVDMAPAQATARVVRVVLAATTANFEQAAMPG